VLCFENYTFMEVDYIIVGLGIAGICFSKQLLEHNKRFLVISDKCSGATEKSGGVFNPIVLRRFTAPEYTIKYTEYALNMFAAMEKMTSTSWMYPDQNVYRIFASIEEQNNWFTASDKPHLKPFLAPKIELNSNNFIQAEFGLGKVLKSFRIDTIAFLQSFQRYFLKTQKLMEESFNHSNLSFQNGDYPIRYKHVKAKAILFAEGTRILQNPFLPKAVIRPNKGEYLIIKAPDLKLDYMLKGGVYIIPLGEDLYKVGATYSHDDNTIQPTQAARKEIEEKLQKMITCHYDVVDQIVGARPVTNDRQPILGEIKTGMYVFNGLGTRGFTRGPYYSKVLFDAIENKQSVPKQMDVKRFLS